MTAPVGRIVAAALGVTTMLSAGLLTGGWWWAVALVGAVAAVGATADRHLAHAHVLATLVLSIGLTVETRLWFVPVVVAGTIGALELGAAADRTSVIRSRVPGLRAVAVAIVGSAALSALVLVAAQLPTVALSGAVVVAALAGVLATRVIAR